MLRITSGIAIAVMSVASLHPLMAADPDRDLSGKWLYDAAASDTRSIPAPHQRSMTVTQTDHSIEWSATSSEGTREERFLTLDGRDTRYKVGEESRSSAIKWEGAALLISTLVSGPQNYSILDRWILSKDRNTLTIGRRVIHPGREDEGTLVYRREGAAVASASPPALGPRPAPPPAADEIVVRSGTRIPLTLRNAIDTRHSHDGDRVYLETLFPITVGNRIVIPRGSFVNGTVTTARQAGIAKKGELFIRFDSIILPNGVTRDFRSRLGAADTEHGKVDREEGKITGERDKAGEAKTTATGAGVGAGVGGIAGAAAGHPLSGVGIGAAAGAAVGLASVLVRHKPDASLPQGTTIEMVLDRDLTFSPAELPR